MGACSVDIHLRERQYQIVNLSDPNVIKWLIEYQDRVNPYFDTSTDNNYDVAGNAQHLNQELVAMYASLEKLIKDSNLDERQLTLIDLVSRGYGFTDIVELDIGFNYASNVQAALDTVYSTIAKTNDLQWKIHIHKSVLETDFKVCNKCETGYPLTNSFYAKNKKNKDGFENVCKKCRNASAKKK
ncbi:hypothetical protein CON15_19940 [Bacillus cereus]|uniref:Uncharacterized protein n=1 Tax=Bacillus thuringiensis TaxID=1428 RepID=A0A9X6U5J3_BACTU|nr:MULTISPECIES: hypothetical protein [Bacillus cereus group]MDO6628686.1 hypothetical protein [Bacillus thuringiensis]MDO6659189.1 hypothetical protein [Bacillus thuringiensis]MDO6698771.1 hypothetical protein [Bacillus thuringiensis]MEB9467796.1 hypothetical protein [Bacillus cereus]MEC0031186.1 hypothetical protein [Bacillus cereus]